jgi:hypothetical protein
LRFHLPSRRDRSQVGRHVVDGVAVPLAVVSKSIGVLRNKNNQTVKNYFFDFNIP